MKKTLIVVFLLFILVGCEPQSDEIDGLFTSIHPQYEGYATHITIQETNFEETLPQKAFEVDIISIKYSPITRRLEIKYTITDDYYQNALYLTVKRIGTSETNIEHVMTSKSQTFTEKFSNVDLSSNVQILFGKFDDDDLNPTPNATAIKTLTFLDLKQAERHQVFLSSHEIEDFKFSDTESPISLSYALQDEHQMIDQLEVVLIENGTKIEVEKISLSIEDLSYEDDIYSFNDLIFNLAKPGVNYDIIVVASGNDGVDDFEDIVISVFNHTTTS